MIYLVPLKSPKYEFNNTQPSNRDLKEAFEEVSAEFKLAQAQQRLMANSSSEEGDGVVSVNLVSLSFDCLLR